MSSLLDAETILWFKEELNGSRLPWTNNAICTQYSPEKLNIAKNYFPKFEKAEKLKLLFSFSHIPPANIKKWRCELEEIIEVATLDPEPWVSTLAKIFKFYPSTGMLNTNIVNECGELDESYSGLTEVIAELKNELAKNSNKLVVLPLECEYLNGIAFESLVGERPKTVKHFTLKKNQKSDMLKRELWKKSQAAQDKQKKETTAPQVPTRSRVMPRLITAKGASRNPSGSSNPVQPTSTTLRFVQTQTATSSRCSTSSRSGVQFLDILELPQNNTQANKRRKLEPATERKTDH